MTEHVNLKEYILAILEEREKNLNKTLEAQERALELAAARTIEERLAQERELFVQKELFEREITSLEENVKAFEDKYKAMSSLMKVLVPLAGVLGAGIVAIVEHLLK